MIDLNIERNLTDVYISWRHIRIEKLDRGPRKRTHHFPVKHCNMRFSLTYTQLTLSSAYTQKIRLIS